MRSPEDVAEPRPVTESPGRIIAHRGASGEAPENTLSAFRAAAGAGASWVEFDVSLLGDETPVVIHDHTLGRTTNRRGRLSRLRRADLEGIDTGSWFGAAFAGERLATLEEALAEIAALDLSANLEIKPHRAPVEPVARVVAGALAACRPWSTRQVLVSSFDVGALAAFRHHLDDQPLALVCHRPAPRWPEVLRDLGAASFHVDIRHLEPRTLERAQAEGVDLRVFTANDPERMVPWRRAGISGIITDHPRRYLDDPDWAAWARSAQAA